MLKWVFAALVIVNVGVALWVYSYGDKPVAPEEEPRLAVHPELMKLATEPGAALKLRAKATPRKLQPPSEPSAMQPACYRAGPFSELEQVLDAARKLETRGIASMRREETRPTVTGYRVYLPPFPTRQAAEAKRKELTKLGFRDHALILDNGRYGVALGFYSVRANAAKQLRRLEAKGVGAKVEPVQQSRTAYWLELSGSNLFETLKDFSWGAGGVSLSEYNCPTIVTEPAAGAGGGKSDSGTPVAAPRGDP